jgi:hypothetical protein
METLANAASSQNSSSAVRSSRVDLRPVALDTTVTSYASFANEQETRASRLSGRTIEYLKYNPTPVPERLIPTVNLSIQEQAELLYIFKTQLMPRFPFVVIPLDTSVETLARERPFLYKSIMMATSTRNPLRQIGKLIDRS